MLLATKASQPLAANTSQHLRAQFDEEAICWWQVGGKLVAGVWEIATSRQVPASRLPQRTTRSSKIAMTKLGLVIGSSPLTMPGDS